MLLRPVMSIKSHLVAILPPSPPKEIVTQQNLLFASDFCVFPPKINAGDVEEVDGLFHDAKASAQLLADDAEGYLH